MLRPSYFCVITPGTYQSIFHRPASPRTLPAATRSLPARVLQRAGIDVLAVDDRLALGHDLGDDFLGHDRAAAGDVGAAVLDAGESAVRVRLPIAGLDLLQLGMRYLSQVQADEHSVAFGANSRRSR